MEPDTVVKLIADHQACPNVQFRFQMQTVTVYLAVIIKQDRKTMKKKAEGKKSIREITLFK